jgi:asparagine N-glycosylation enzyme membrane subunit Stt3
MKHDDTGAYYDDDIKEEHKPEETTTSIQKLSTRKVTLLICTLLFLGAFAIRLFYLLYVTDPDNPGAGWFGDSYHHWQIGYLTQQLGWHNGFMRVWDLKGMDLFWGLLHPTALALIFSITGNSSMAVERGLTSFTGSLSVALIYLLGRKYWNEKSELLQQ